ncbi:hypothetical protein K2173_021802 [Erythroxylum novogranatense]|uniref:Endonuclease/exonuclease/phosphatase domain-containing protein n=1 Tax=Erythroxylum novogranatense TaxID=1862640 RepID=A0AAV8TV30_9ROSI|nr:hypothetical protein K2173_021802 [Erythroxylum novogranatense]
MGLRLMPWDDLLHFRLLHGFADAPSSGDFFTWQKNRRWARLDRVLLNREWSSMRTLDVRPLSHVSESDHCPLLVDFHHAVPPGSKPFKFYNMWLDHPACDAVVEEVWRTLRPGCAQFALCSWLSDLKQPLRHLNHMVFSGISARVRDTQEDFQHFYQAFLVCPEDEALRCQVNLLRKKVVFLQDAERSFFRQKANCTHLLEADKSTKYFHALARKRSRNKMITHLTREDGTETTSLIEVSTMLVDYFSQLLGTPHASYGVVPAVISNGQLLCSEAQSHLLAPFSDDDIRQALFSIGSEKAPGPDGFSSEFFKRQWPCVGPSVCAAVQEFFRTEDPRFAAPILRLSGVVCPPTYDVVVTLSPLLHLSFVVSLCFGCSPTRLTRQKRGWSKVEFRLGKHIICRYR